MAGRPDYIEETLLYLLHALPDTTDVGDAADDWNGPSTFPALAPFSCDAYRLRGLPALHAQLLCDAPLSQADRELAAALIRDVIIHMSPSRDTPLPETWTPPTEADRDA